MKNLKYTPFRRLAAAVLTCCIMLTPTAVRAAEAETTEIPDGMAVSKTVESNSWENWPDGPAVSAESAIVMEADTGMILYAKDIEAKRYPASITKILTALIALEKCELNEEITYSYYATHSIEFGSSSIARTEDEILTVEESLYGLMLSSANECANALAEHIAGSVDDFTVLMNEKIKELGCVNTHFTNANGLHNEDHYTCAYDMALITKAAIANEDFRRIAGAKTYDLRATNKNPDPVTLQNHHCMIYPYRTDRYVDDTIFAGKTGYTTDALYTLMTCGHRNDMDVIVISMRSTNNKKGEPLYTDTIALLDYANNFQKLNISENEKTFVVGNAYDFSLESDDTASASSSLISIDKNSTVILPNDVSFADADASITFEQQADGSKPYLTYKYAGQIVGKAPITLEEIKETKQPQKEENNDTKSTKFITINFKVILIVLFVLLLLFLLALSIRNFLSRNRAKIRKAVQIYRKRRFLKKRRYRRKRRR